MFMHKQGRERGHVLSGSKNTEQSTSIIKRKNPVHEDSRTQVEDDDNDIQVWETIKSPAYESRKDVLRKSVPRVHKTGRVMEYSRNDYTRGKQKVNEYEHRYNRSTLDYSDSDMGQSLHTSIRTGGLHCIN